ncbi:type VI secretion system-associated FHA domain protein [Pseudomonas syringae group genomosp. 3]|uniref:type VI secretion system-associated FHA domain protein n=1 Tax=Pseudomonas syringae group genomosp. 3 TaxID=251701 RepID=UPI0021808E4D|nr:type VI secretion system-associated FHA domain protein [Pseudomonas syringae group genomosp. 3]
MNRPFNTGSPTGLEQACGTVGDFAAFIVDDPDTRQLQDCAGVEGDYLCLPQLIASPIPAIARQREEHTDAFWKQFGGALGIELTSVDLATREASAIKVARLFKRCLAGLQQSLKIRNEITDELYADLSDITHPDVSGVESATGETLINSLLNEEPRYLLTEETIARAFRELQAHETAMLAGCRAMAQATLEHFSPRQLGWQFERDRGRPWLLTDGRQWRDYARHHHDLQRSGQWDEHLLAHNFAPAYQQQFRLIVSFHQDVK